MIVIFLTRSRGHQATGAGGMQAAEAALHRAQRAWIGGQAPAYLAARPTLLVHAFPDAECCGRNLRTAVEITINAACRTASDRSKGLQTRENEPPISQAASSALELAAWPIRLWWSQRLSHLIAGLKHCGHAELSLFEPSGQAVQRRMNGERPVRRDRSAPAHREHGDADQPRDEARMEARVVGPAAGAVGSRTTPT